MKTTFILALALVSFSPVQDPSLDDLIRKLTTDDFTEQGKAAAALEQMGKTAVPHLQKIQKETSDARVRTWCGWILEKIEARGARFKDLIDKLASPDDEIKEAAERELLGIGAPAVPYLQEQLKSEDKNRRRRAEKLLAEIGSQESPAGVRVAPASLHWLARHQNADGSWGAENFTNQCVGKNCLGSGDSDYDVGLTGLALLAFLQVDFTQLSKEEFPDPIAPTTSRAFGKVVRRGLAWLVSKQDAEGCIGGRGTKYMYNHAMACWALVESYRRTTSEMIKGPAQQAVDFLVASQNPGKGWRYSKQSGDNDTSVTGWAVLALSAARRAKLNVPDAVFAGAKAWLDEVTDASIYYRTGYNGKSSGKVFIPGKNENFQHHETMTAISVLSRIVMEKDRRDAALAGVALIVKDLPEWKDESIDYYYWMWATSALYQYDGPTGPYWKKWCTPMKETLLKNQKSVKDGCAAGSWPSDSDRWGFEGGRVYAVALNSLTLATYYGVPVVK